LLLVLPEEQADADWVVDHLVTKIHGKAAPTDKTPHSATVASSAAEHSHVRQGFGKLKIQSSRFSGSDTEQTADESEEGDHDIYRKDDTNDSGQDDEEWEELKKRDWIKLPFELQCVDSVLFCVNEMHARDTKQLVQESSQYIEAIVLQKNIGDHFQIIRFMKDAHKSLASRVRSFCASLTRVLNEGKDFWSEFVLERLVAS
jgi:hypothetical protein